MLQKWKIIITNWINCYFNENNQDARTVNIKSLLNIISHLRENLNLDESKSSKLEAHTVEEFVLEKYPEFKFENGTVEATNEDEIYLVASLLLFFVCVNSKDVDIKSAMCSKLSGEDQEIILKFSKSLLECSPITCRDVLTAITDACGLDMATIDTGHVKVAETPPALRSLHGEVRRLQAALDAERFDRNYLQEELARTNLRLEKLSKDKEQYKLDIVNLKAKISMCCGQEHDVRGTEAEAESSAKLVRQLHDLEEGLARTQEMLDDAVYERDTYIKKVNELKQDRDKWLALSQQESALASQLAEELETERRHTQSLRELVTELRQHNRLNGLDSSQLECDDPDASIQSLQHNLSVCSEACVNVVEVQLSEEKAKVDALKQQLQRLQEDMNGLNQRLEFDKNSYSKVLSERENEIFDLKHRINEEIEEKNHLKSHYNDVTSTLNNEINELEQKIKDNNDNSRLIIEKKMQEIQTLQEEKLSLLQSLTDETTKSENIITGLKKEIETEKQSRLNMRDAYENQMMKLNEKVLNRNNELVELQNNIFKKGEVIETLQMDLRKEKELSNKYHHNIRQLEEQKRELELGLQNKTEQVNTMQKNITSVLEEIDHFKSSVASLQEHCRQLEGCKMQLEAELDNQTSRFEELYKDAENVKNAYREKIEKLKFDLDERNAIINTLQTHLQDEINFKIGLQEELQKLQSAKLMVSEELNKLNTEFLKKQTQLHDKEKTIEAINMNLNQEKNRNEKLISDIEELKKNLTKATNDICEKSNNIVLLNEELESARKSYEVELCDKMDTIEGLNHKLATVIAKKNALEGKIDLLNNEKTKLDNDLISKCKEVLQLQAERERMSKVIDESKKAIRSLDQNMTKEKQKYGVLEKTFDTEMSKMMVKLNETEKNIKELSSSSRKAIKNKDHQIHTLNSEIESLKRALDVDKENVDLLHKEREALSQKLTEEISYKNKIEKEYQNQCTQLASITSQLNEEICARNGDIVRLKMELDLAKKTTEGKCKEIRMLEDRIAKEDQLIRELAHQKTVDTKDLQRKLGDLESFNYELQQEVKKAYDCKKQAIEALEKENEQLQFAIEEDNSSHEVILKEKDCVIDRLERQLKEVTAQLESIRKDYEDETLTWEKYKVESKDIIAGKEEQIGKLRQEVILLQKTLSEAREKIEVMAKEMHDAEKKNKDEMHKLVESLKSLNAISINDKQDLESQLLEEKAAKDDIETEKNQLSKNIKMLLADKDKLLNEKIVLTQELTEERTLRKILEEERNAVVTDNAIFERKLLKQVATTESLLEDKECLTQQLVEEKSAKELAEKEKENLLLEKHMIERKISEVESNKEEMSREIDNLIEKHSLLDQQFKKERAIYEVLKEEKTKLLQDFTEEKSHKDVLFKEYNCLVSRNESLKHDLLEHETIQEFLINDKESLLVEKEGLVKSLGLEKSAHDEIETEKDHLNEKLNELKEKYASEVNSKNAELEKVAEDIKHLQTHYKNQEEYNQQLLTTLNVGLENLVDGVRKEGLTNEVLHKLLESKNEDMAASDKCDLLINIASTLTNELVMRKNLEKALEHENSALAELREVLRKKEMQLFELQSESKQLHTVINENKIELSKITESYNTALENKSREMQLIQQDNQSLTNELNDMKLQLEVKVHSLKEKLIDNENLTDKLKKTYECQIENLNIMVTKLTNYLKDKTTDLEASRKEKERLQQTIEENNQAIKSLEEEVKCEKQNLEKLINDFESERQVLKNMVTVTESIMEDQKVTLNNVISENVRSNEILQEEIKSVKELVVTERKNYEEILLEKDNALELVLKEIAEVKFEKEKIKNEGKLQEELVGNEKHILEVKLRENDTALVTALNEILEVRLEKDKFENEVKVQKELAENEKNLLEVKLLEKETMLETALNEISEVRLEKEKFENEVRVQKELVEKEKHILEIKLLEKEKILESLSTEIDSIKHEKDKIAEEVTTTKNTLEEELRKVKDDLQNKMVETQKLNDENKYLSTTIQKYRDDMNSLEKLLNDLKVQDDAIKVELRKEIDKLTKQLNERIGINKELECTLKEKTENIKEMEEKAKLLHEQINILELDKNLLEEDKNVMCIENKECVTKMCYMDSNIAKYIEKNAKLNNDNLKLLDILEENKSVILNLEQLLKEAQQKATKVCDDTNNDKLNLINKCAILQEYHDKAETELDERQKDVISLQKELKTLQSKLEIYEEDSKAKDGIISKMSKEKDAVIVTLSKELQEEKAFREKYQKEIEEKTTTIAELKQNLEVINNEREALNILRKENEVLIKAVGQRETCTLQSQERTSSHKHSGQAERELRDLHHQVDNTSSDFSHSSMESIKTISDLEKIIHDKNRTITMLQSDLTYLKTLMAESETKLLDVVKEHEVSKENCHQLSTQLKKIVHQKNEEIADLKKQVTKMSVTENRASQIIKVSAKYQAIILKRIAEIKTNTVLKELTNFGNSNTYDNEVKRSLNAGSITMEDLENFLETTDRHLKKCSDKQLALQRERDRLTEVNRINESEIINLKKFLTELSVSFQTFSSVKDLYAQKLSRVISVQRTVRREILSLDGHVTDACMGKLERGYAAVMQDLAECALNLERWVERCIGRTISSEKLKQAFMSDSERTSLATTSFQNAGLEVQLEELEKSFQKLLEDVSRAQKGEGTRDTQASTVMEVRAEYEDKLNRMKAKMKQLYTEQIAVFKEKQKEEISMLERELCRARDKLAESSRAYEEHIRDLTTELWSVGEKFLMKKDEAEWLRRRRRSGSLMSLQHVHSSGLVPAQELPPRPSDSHSLRSLPVNNNEVKGNKREGRGLHMSDEEGEVFDNRWLKELSATPRRASVAPPGQRLSELRWRNSLCPPHLKSSYPAETQFTAAVDEEDIKCIGATSTTGAKQRKEVGITAYKKPGPPTPSKQAGRLSATDSELRESLRVEAEPQPSRKTSTPSRIRSLFRSSRNDTAEGTPRSRRLSNIFRKK